MTIDMTKHFSSIGLIKIALPSIAMMLFTSFYGIVDGFFVSNFAGKSAFAAANLVMPYVMILSIPGFMVGTGGSALVAKTLGEANSVKANEYFSLLSYFCLALGVILAIIGYFTIRPVALMMGASGELLEMCETYGCLLMISTPFFSLQYHFQAFFAAAGRPQTGFKIILIAGLSNILLDFLFVGFFGWGLKGAALATIIGEYLGGLLPVIYFLKPSRSALRLGNCYFEPKIIGKACANGLSEMVSNIAVSVVSILYNYQLMQIAGEEGVAAYGVIMYSFLIFAAIFIGFNISTAPLISFQYGAQNRSEIKNLFRKSILITVFAGLAMLLTSEISAPFLAQLFVGYDNQVFQTTLYGFRIFSLSYFLMGIPLYTSAFFTALNNGLISALISFSQSFIFELACILILPQYFGLTGIWLSVSVAGILSTTLSRFLLASIGKQYLQ